MKDAQIVVNSGETEKMSEVILRFADPILHGADGVIDTHALRFAITVWNASLLPTHAQTEALKTLVNMW